MGMLQITLVILLIFNSIKKTQGLVAIRNGEDKKRYKAGLITEVSSAH